jgi:hypothetical protein
MYGRKALSRSSSRSPTLHLGALCDYLDMDPEEFVDERNYLLEA